MRCVIILQARSGSTRLPGKVLMDLAGKPMLFRQLQRLTRCTEADDIVVATTTNSADDAIVDVARAASVRWFRGSERDVLSRYVGAAQESHAEVVIRVTADCPLIDPMVTDRVIRTLLDHQSSCDYASNVVERTFPQGLDTEALFLDTLMRVNRLGQSAAAREHVTLAIYNEFRHLFSLVHVKDDVDNSDLRWTVDFMQDLELVRRLYESMELADGTVGFRELARFQRHHPELMSLNAVP